MGFMVPQVCHMKMLHVETDIGTEYIPADLVGEEHTHEDLLEYCEGSEVFEVSWEEGFYCREHAPGYLDCTEWVGPFATEEEAVTEYCDVHDICEKCFDQCFYGEEGCPAE